MFKIGDKVIVRRLASFSNNNIIGGFTGACLYNEYSDEIGSLVNVVWDDATLDRMPPEYKAYCEKLKVNCKFYIIPTNQLYHVKG